jgi:hypothetical protein
MKSLSNLPELPDLIETDQDQILSQVV